MKRFCGSFVLRTLLCAALTLLAAMPAFAAMFPWPVHVSAAELVDGESNYDNAEFRWLHMGLNDNDIKATQEYVDATASCSINKLE